MIQMNSALARKRTCLEHVIRLPTRAKSTQITHLLMFLQKLLHSMNLFMFVTLNHVADLVFRHM